MKKQIYLASPFFKPEQLERILLIEDTILRTDGLTFYSPRLEGVLQEMTPEDRKANATKIFDTNVRRIIHSEGLLAVLDEPDTGTHWECGFAFYHKRYFNPHYKLMAFKQDMVRPINVMLQKSFDGVAYGLTNLEGMLADFATGKPFDDIQLAEVY